MSEDKYISALKKLKEIKNENKTRVEKVKNVDLEKKKKIINAIVNTQIIVDLINNSTIFDPRTDSSKLVWIDENNVQLNLVDAIRQLRVKLEEY